MPKTFGLRHSTKLILSVGWGVMGCSFVLLLCFFKRDEADAVAIQSGTEFGVTLGTPIALRVQNKDQRPHDYSDMDLYPRPSHADWTYLLKYGVKASSGGGRSSARETIGPFHPI